MKIFFRKYGEGPPLVILHGLYGSSDNWVSIAKSLSGRFTVFLPDLRNHGSSPHSGTHDYESMCIDLLEFATDQKLKSFFLAGHSMGGKTAVRFALQKPEIIEGLIVADISPFGTKTSNDGSYKQHLEILKILSETDFSKSGSRAELEELFEGSIISGRTRGLILKNIKRNDDGSFSWKINNKALLANIEGILGSVVAPKESFEPVTGFPVIFLRGENSDYLPSSDYKKILKLFPAAEFRTIKNAGHWLHVDNPEEVTEAFLGLLDH
jgi:pimeloyl-ACP methyl ester carboxylesterase